MLLQISLDLCQAATSCQSARCYDIGPLVARQQIGSCLSDARKTLQYECISKVHAKSTAESYGAVWACGKESSFPSGSSLRLYACSVLEHARKCQQAQADSSFSGIWLTGPVVYFSRRHLAFKPLMAKQHLMAKPTINRMDFTPC